MLTHKGRIERNFEQVGTFWSNLLLLTGIFFILKSVKSWHAFDCELPLPASMTVIVSNGPETLFRVFAALRMTVNQGLCNKSLIQGLSFKTD
ncbi:MAG: hypothetical protein BGO39_35770 [Chloroflexi bacterium 54-19]|nr:MAG: hypothetical protein BGO39_35770 [Chloroflexi bacterium 54-19]